MNAMDRAPDRSMDAITRRAVRRMTFGKDAATILRIHELARDHRSHRAAMAFLSALRFPVQAPSQVPASEVGPDDEREEDFYDDKYLASLDAQAARAVDRAQRRGQKRHEPNDLLAALRSLTTTLRHCGMTAELMSSVGAYRGADGEFVHWAMADLMAKADAVLAKAEGDAA